MSTDLQTIDHVDLLVLRALHEFEYDPCEFGQPRVSPVPLYLVFAAVWPVSQEKPYYEGVVGLNVNLHARLEGLRALGYVRSARLNWQTFDKRLMRDGRFIAVMCERGMHRLPVDNGEDVHQGFLEFRVYFDHKSHFYRDVDEARTKHPGVNDVTVVHTVLDNGYKRLSWRHYNEDALAEWYRKIGHANARRNEPNEYGSCYALTRKGIECVRKDTDSGHNPPQVLPSSMPAVVAPEGDRSTHSEPERSKKLAPSRLRAAAVYEWAVESIPGADDMPIRELYTAIHKRLEATIAAAPPHGSELEKLQELLNALPDNSETFGKYLREAGIKRYTTQGERARRISHFGRRNQIQ